MFNNDNFNGSLMVSIKRIKVIVFNAMGLMLKTFVRVGKDSPKTSNPAIF